MNNAAQKTQLPQDNPLDRLGDMLHDDMEHVNTMILKHLESDVTLIPQIARYLIASGGKRIRPLLTLACARLYGDTSNRAYGLAAAVEFIHTATLLHDDVVDESKERRGKDAANLVFGNQATVLVGDFLFSRAFQLMVSDGSLEVLRILSGASAIIAQGEVMQLTTTNNLETTLSDYEEVIKSKTAALFSAACEIGPVLAGQDKSAANAMVEYGTNLGLAFQVIDDVLDYSAPTAKLGKEIGDDFREGKMTAPVILALENATAEEHDFWARTIGHKNQKEGDLQTAQKILERTNALKRGTDMARHYAHLAAKSLHTAPEHEIRDLLGELITFTINRDH